jgi:hypothetical protein
MEVTQPLNKWLDGKVRAAEMRVPVELENTGCNGDCWAERGTRDQPLVNEGSWNPLVALD